MQVTVNIFNKKKACVSQKSITFMILYHGIKPNEAQISEINKWILYNAS